MCGIAGTWGETRPELLEAMLAKLVHRGPDGAGAYRSEDGLVTLGSRRLAIIDLAGGAQPMTGEDRSVWLVANGEIYNHVELRRDLEAQGHRFASACDTEVLVHLYEEHGDGFVSLVNGEFAFALHDARRGRLLLGRDRLGIRPLYYAEAKGQLHFASEMPALLAAPDRARRVAPEALACYLALRYVSGERSMLAGIRRLPPGHLLVKDAAGIRLQPYWEVPRDERPMPPGEAGEELEARLDASVRMRLMSDVPLGMYLSGGVDSGLLLALMARAGRGPVKTFSVGFGLPLDETAEAAALAKAYGADHHEIRLSPRSWEDLPAIAAALDEPIGDSIVVPTFHLAREASRHVKVVLTGEGADEIFGGYVHHGALPWLHRYRARVPAPLRRGARRAVAVLPDGIFDRVFPYPDRLGASGRDRVLSVVGGGSGSGYLELCQLFAPDERARLSPLVAAAAAPMRWEEELEASLKGGDGSFFRRLVAFDARRWLPDYTLLKQDRLTMASSIEGRVPYLDHRLVELVMRFPDALRRRGRVAKVALREVAARHLPAESAARAKRAFYLPVGRFFDAGFPAFVRDVLAPGALARDGILDPAAVAPLVEPGLADDLLAGKRLMAVLILTLWYRAHGIAA